MCLQTQTSETLQKPESLRPPRAVRGLKVPGNIDLYAQPENPEGWGRVHSFSVEIGGKQLLLPRVHPTTGKYMSENEAIDYYQTTGKHLGIFDTHEDADVYSRQLSADYGIGKYGHKVKGK